MIQNKNIGVKRPIKDGRSFNPVKKNPNHTISSKNKLGCRETFHKPSLNI